MNAELMPMDYKDEMAEIALKHIDQIVTNHFDNPNQYDQFGDNESDAMTLEGKVIKKYDPQHQRLKRIYVAKEYDGKDYAYNFESLKSSISKIYDTLYGQTHSQQYLDKFCRESEQTLENIRVNKKD